MQKKACSLFGALCFSQIPFFNRDLTNKFKKTVALTALSLLWVSNARAEWTKTVVANPHLHQFQIENSNSYDCMQAIQFRSEPYLNYVSLTIALGPECNIDTFKKDMFQYTKLPITDFFFRQLYLQIPIVQAYEGFSVLKGFASSGFINKTTLKAMIEILADQIAFVSDLYTDPEKLEVHYRQITAD